MSNLPEGITANPGGGGVTARLDPSAMRATRAGIPAEARPSTFGNPAAVATGAAPTPGPAPVQFAAIDAGVPAYGTSAGEFVAYANRALAAGQITAEDAAAMLREAGLSPRVENRSSAQIAHDNLHGRTGVEPGPDDYQHVRVPDAAHLTPEEFAVADTAIRGALAGFGIDPKNAQGFVGLIDDADRAVDACRSPEEQIALVQRWQDDLVAVVGPDAFSDANWAPIKALVDRLGENPLTRHMRENGLLFHPKIALALLNRTANVANWRAGRPTK